MSSILEDKNRLLAREAELTQSISKDVEQISTSANEYLKYAGAAAAGVSIIAIGSKLLSGKKEKSTKSTTSSSSFGRKIMIQAGLLAFGLVKSRLLDGLFDKKTSHETNTTQRENPILKK